MTEQQNKPQPQGETTPSSGELGWLLKPRTGSGISIYIAGAATAERLTPEALQTLEQQMVELQEKAITLSERDCPALDNCGTYSGTCDNLTKCGTYS